MSSEPRGYLKPSAHPQGVSFLALDWAQGPTLQPPHTSNANMIINAIGELSRVIQRSIARCVPVMARASSSGRSYASPARPRAAAGTDAVLVVTTILITAAIAVLVIES